VVDVHLEERALIVHLSRRLIVNPIDPCVPLGIRPLDLMTQLSLALFNEPLTTMYLSIGSSNSSTSYIDTIPSILLKHFSNTLAESGLIDVV
jgi:hypothetical protein